MEPLKYILYFFVISILALQFVQPEKNDTQRRGENSLSENTESFEHIDVLLDRSCYDCHSDQTNYPWYASVSPVSWYIADHVEKGKKRLNFSRWNLYTESKKDSLEKNIADLVKRRWMPLHDYLGQHKEAVLNEEELNQIVQYFDN